MLTDKAIKSITVRTDINTAVTRLAETCYLVNKSRIGIIKLIHITLAGEFAVFSRTEVDDTHSSHTSHPQAFISIYQRTDTSSHEVTSLKRHLKLATSRVIKEDTVITTNPQSFIALVVCQGTNMRDNSGILWLHLKTVDLVGIIHVKPIYSSTPCTNP